LIIPNINGKIHEKNGEIHVLVCKYKNNSKNFHHASFDLYSEPCIVQSKLGGEKNEAIIEKRGSYPGSSNC
jgi:hypothetical protein